MNVQGVHCIWLRIKLDAFQCKTFKKSHFFISFRISQAVYPATSANIYDCSKVLYIFYCYLLPFRRDILRRFFPFS